MNKHTKFWVTSSLTLVGGSISSVLANKLGDEFFSGIFAGLVITTIALMLTYNSAQKEIEKANKTIKECDEILKEEENA